VTLRRKLALLLAALSCLAAAWGLIRWWTLAGWLSRELADQVPFPLYVQGVERVRPLSVRFDRVRVPHPSGESHPDVLTIRSLTLTLPWWGLWMRPTPVAMEMEAPRVVLDADLADLLLRQVNFLPMGEQWQSPEEQRTFRQFQGAALLSIRLVPMGLKIRRGHLELEDPQVRPDGPLYTVGDFQLDLWMTSPWEYPSIHLKANGNFLKPDGKPVGSLTMETGAGAALQRMHGALDIWYQELADFRTVYQDAPQPFTFEGGAGGPVIEWRIEGERVKVSMRCRAEGLEIGGTIGEVPWQAVLDALADPAGKIDLTVRAEGSLKDPGFSPHDRLLSELDWAMREGAAAKGVRVPGRIFYGLAHRDEFEEAEPVPE